MNEYIDLRRRRRCSCRLCVGQFQRPVILLHSSRESELEAFALLLLLLLATSCFSWVAHWRDPHTHTQVQVEV